MQSLLAAQSQVASFTESHFFNRHFTLLPLSTVALLIRDPRSRLHDFLVENRITDNDRGAALEAGLSELLGMRLMLPLRTRAVASRLLHILDELAVRQRKPIWIEKTPQHLRYLPFLERLSGSRHDTRFVHVIRHGLDVVASLHSASQAWERPYDLSTCVDRWNRDVAFSLSRIGSPSDHFVFYEDLTERPEQTLADLCRRLDLSWEPEILHRYGEQASKLIAPNETWKENVSDRIRPSTRTERYLSEGQRRFVRKSVRNSHYARIREATT